MHTAALVALSDKTRQRIVEMLAEGERSVGEIASGFAMTPAAISQHLKVLRRARLVSVRKVAQRRIYALDRAGLVALTDWLARIEAACYDRA